MESKQDKSGRTIVQFIPKTAGNYMIHILYKKQSISLSPYELIVIQLEKTNYGIREMVFNGWDIEAASILAEISKKPLQHHLIFEIGMTCLFYLFGSSKECILKDMNTILSHLLENEENHIRIAREGSIQFVNKILKNPYWLHNEPICKFISRVISFALETNTNFRKQYVKKIGIEPLLNLASNSNIEIIRHAVKSFFIISIHLDNITYLLKHGLFMEALIHFLRDIDDIMVKRYCLHTFFNLTKSDLFINSLTQRKLNLFVQQLVTNDRRLKLDVLIILSQVNSPLSTKAFIESNIYENIYNCLSTESTIQWWEIQYLFDANADDNDGENNDNCFNIDDFLNDHLLNSENRLQSDMNTVTLRYLNCIFNSATRNERDAISDHICEFNYGNTLHNICLLSGSIEIRVQKEACKLLCYLSENRKCGKKILKNDEILWLLGSFKNIDTLRQKYLFITLANLSYYFTPSFTFPDDNLVNYFLQTTKSQDQILQENSVIICAHLLKNPKYHSMLLLYNNDEDEISDPSLLSNNYDMEDEEDIYENILIKPSRVKNVLLLNKILDVARNNKKILSIHLNNIKWKQIEFNDESDKISGLNSLSNVYKCNVNGVTYAIKKFNLNDLQFNFKEFQSEIAIMSLIHHKNIVSSMGASIKKPNLFILSNYYSNGNLIEFLKKQDNKIKLSFIISILIDITEGMKFLHSLNIIHRDLKPANILIHSDFHASITDFGTSRVFKDRMSPTIGTTMYMAPDLVESNQYTKKCDVYSFGILFWEILERRIPFPSLQPIDIISIVKSGVRPKFLIDKIPKFIQNFIELCWHSSPDIRPSFDDISIQLIEFKEKIKNENLDFILPSPIELNENLFILKEKTISSFDIPLILDDLNDDLNDDRSIDQNKLNSVVSIQKSSSRKPSKLSNLRKQTSKRFDRMKSGLIAQKSKFSTHDSVIDDSFVSSNVNLTPPSKTRRRRKSNPHSKSSKQPQTPVANVISMNDMEESFTQKIATTKITKKIFTTKT